MKREIPQEGEVFEMAYPFVRGTVELIDGDGVSKLGAYKLTTWQPGIRQEPRGDSPVATADGIGKQTLTIAGTFKPGRFPRRVFFTRKWTDPDGKSFGKDSCRITTINAFRSLTNGYRHPFTFDGKAYGRSFYPHGKTTVEMLTALIQEAGREA